MNKKLIKQAVFIVVCAVLIISAAFLSLDFNEVAAGAGKGTNAKIETMLLTAWFLALKFTPKEVSD